MEVGKIVFYFFFFIFFFNLSWKICSDRSLVPYLNSQQLGISAASAAKYGEGEQKYKQAYKT